MSDVNNKQAQDKSSDTAIGNLGIFTTHEILSIEQDFFNIDIVYFLIDAYV